MDEAVKSIGWRPQQRHAVDVLFAVNGLCLAVFVREPFKDFTKYGVGACDANAFVSKLRMW